MAARLSPWISGCLVAGVGAGLGWLAGTVFMADVELAADSMANEEVLLARANAISEEWLSLPELTQRFSAFSAEESQSLLTTMPASFWCSHPNGREALRMAVSRLSERHAPAELTRELFRLFRAWDLPGGTRLEALGNVVEALAAVSEITPQMMGGELHGSPQDEVRAAAGIFIQQRRGTSIEGDAAVLRQFLSAAGWEDKSLPRVAAELAAAAWFDLQPEAAIAFTANANGEFNDALRPLLRRLYAVDAPAAVAALRQMAENGKSYWTGECAFLTGLSAAELREVIQAVPSSERVNAMQGYAIELALQSPGAVLEFAKVFSAADLYTGWTHEETRDHGGLLALLPLFAERDPAACREWLGSLTTERRVKILRGAGAPNAAFARFCLEDPDFHLTWENGSHLLSTLAAEDPAAALRETPRFPEKQRLEAEAAVHGMAILSRYSGDIARIMQALDEVPENIRSTVTAGVYPSLALRFQPQIQDWIAANRESPHAIFLEAAVAARATFQTVAEREAVLGRALPLIEASPAVASIAESHLGYLAETNPAAATEWFARIPEGERKVGIAQTIAQTWAKTDTAAAAQWAEGMPRSASRDGALLQLANVQRSEPEQALQRIQQIAAAETRFIATQSLVHEWAPVDPDRAIQIIAQIPASAEQRRKLEAIVHASPLWIRRMAAQ